MRAGAPATTEAKNHKGWALWTEFIREVGGDSPPLRRPDPDHFVHERLLKNMLLLWRRTKCVSSLRGRTTSKPESLLGHLYAVKSERDTYAISFLTKGMTHQLTLTLGREYELVHGPESLAPRKRESLTPRMVRALIRAVDGQLIDLRGSAVVPHGSW
jgi:hypothetical protein